MAKQTGTFVPDERLRARDDSGGPKGPKGISDFGAAGKGVGGEPSGMNERTGQEDEMKRPARSSTKRGGY